MPRLSDMQFDAMREMVNIGVGRAASMLNDLLDKHVDLSVPDIVLSNPQNLLSELQGLSPDDRLASVRLGFRGGVSGSSSIVFTPDTAMKLVNVLTDGDMGEDEDLNALKVGTLSEVGNIVMNGVMGSMSNMLDLRLIYSLPNYVEDNAERVMQVEHLSNEVPVLLAKARFVVEALDIQGVIYLVFAAETFERLLEKIDIMLEAS